MKVVSGGSTFCSWKKYEAEVKNKKVEMRNCTFYYLIISHWRKGSVNRWMSTIISVLQLVDDWKLSIFILPHLQSKFQLVFERKSTQLNSCELGQCSPWAVYRDTESANRWGWHVSCSISKVTLCTDFELGFRLFVWLILWRRMNGNSRDESIPNYF